MQEFLGFENYFDWKLLTNYMNDVAPKHLFTVMQPMSFYLFHVLFIRINELYYQNRNDFRCTHCFEIASVDFRLFAMHFFSCFR